MNQPLLDNDEDGINYGESELRDRNATGENENGSDNVSENKTTKKYGYSFIGGIGIVINYSIGTGCFGLPYSFYSAGLSLALIMMSVFLLLTILTSIFTIEAMERTCKEKTEKDEIDQGMYDFTLISRTFHSKEGKKMTSILMILVNYCYLWGYVATGSNTLMTLYWLLRNEQSKCDTVKWTVECASSYYVALVIFMLFTVPFAYISLNYQAKFQTFMMFYRIVMFTVLLVVIVIQLCYGPVQLGNHKIDTAWIHEWKFGNFGVLFSHVAVAFSVQTCLPDALQYIRNRKSLVTVTNIGTFITFIIYILIGSLGASVFTASATNPVTLNFQYYTGRNG